MASDLIKDLKSTDSRVDEDIIEGFRNREPENQESINAVLDLPSEDFAKSSGIGITDFLKKSLAGALRECDLHRQGESQLIKKLAKAEAERDVAQSKLSDLRDVNFLHSMLLALSTALLSFYVSYDSAGSGKSYAILLWVGLGCFGAWLAFLIYRFTKK